jgi:hypothetical protein
MTSYLSPVSNEGRKGREGGNRVSQLDDVGMAEELEDLNLTAYLRIHRLRRDLLSVQDLDGDLVARHLMPPHCTTSRSLSSHSLSPYALLTFPNVPTPNVSPSK